MQLNTVSKISHNDLLYIVKSVRVVKIYYAFKGRNAWWSTWVSRYENGCMHSTFESAASFCEKSRVQGTVFYINELSALAFCAGKHSVIISEINSTKILNKFNFKVLTALTSILPVSTLTLEQITHIFDVNSSMWSQSQSRSNSIFQVYSEDAENLIDLKTNEILKHNTSNSTGPKHYLNWSEENSQIESKYILNLVNTLNDRIQKNS